MQFLHYDNPVMTGIAKFANCVFLSILWLIGCIPVITAGVSTCALYYAVEKNIKNDRDYVISAYWSAFKDNFRQGTAIWAILLAVEALLISDYWILEELGKSGHALGDACILFQIFMALVLLYAIWVLSMIGRFQNTFGQILKNSFILMIRHIGSSLLIMAFVIFGVLTVWLIPLTVCLMPAVVFWIISVPIENVFKKYRCCDERNCSDSE